LQLGVLPMDSEALHPPEYAHAPDPGDAWHVVLMYTAPCHADDVQSYS
jgi:hypothetical protein